MFVVIDLETTGVDPSKDAIVEIAKVECDYKGNELRASEDLIDPGFPIPPKASAVHHIIDDDVFGCETIDQALDRYNNEEAIYVAHNCKFECAFLPMLTDRPWICTYKSAMRVWPDASTHTNQGLRYELKLDVARDIGLPHRALPDCYVTAALLKRLLEVASVDDMIRWTNSPVLKKVCHFGKHRDTLWSEVPRSYLQWIVNQGDFDEDVIYTANVYLGNIEHK